MGTGQMIHWQRRVEIVEKFWARYARDIYYNSRIGGVVNDSRISDVICFMGGAVVGFIISALLTAGRDDK